MSMKGCYKQKNLIDKIRDIASLKYTLSVEMKEFMQIKNYTYILSLVLAVGILRLKTLDWKHIKNTEKHG